MVGNLGVGQDPLERMSGKGPGQDNLTRHHALGGQDAADGGEADQPADAAKQLVAADTDDASRGPNSLAGMQEPHRRKAIAQDAADRERDEPRQSLREKCSTRPTDAPGGLKHHERNDEQQDLIGKPG